ncbi:MAG TPA: complex I subunit 1 family protein [Myxococcaceae bacterium]|nr:complex I subunit 1 family protein [Myxococcaceae bacterium]
MKALQVLIAIGVILGAIFGISAATYALGGWIESGFPVLGHVLVPGGLPGWSWTINLVVLLLVFVMVIATFLTLAERKWSAMMQDRIGPNRATIDLPGLRGRPLGGLFHVATDALKMLFKEDFRPKNADKLLFNLGPILAFAPVLALFAVVPVGPVVDVGGHRIGLQVADPNFGLLWVLAIASLAVYGTSLAGWSSNNKFALLGGVRASSQMISYEVALGLGLVGAMMVFSTVRLPELIQGQTMHLWGGAVDVPGLGVVDVGIPAWGIFLQPIGFVVFFTAAFAETKRAPFDVPEGESEIIGYFVEYSGMKFGLFMISEFAEVVILAAITTAVFLGGWHLGFAGDAWLTERLAGHGILLGAIYSTIFWIKVLVLCYLQLAIRWTFPRFRYDQIQTLGWKILLPQALANVFVTGALVLLDPSLRTLAVVGFLEIGFVLALAMRLTDTEAGHAAGDTQHSADAHGQAPAPLPGPAAASHH